MKTIDHLNTELSGLTALGRDEYLGLAREVANRTSGVRHVKSDQRGDLFGVQRGGRTVATFDVRTLRRDDADDGRIKVDVSWSEETLSKASPDGTVGILRGYLTGMPGFGPYRAYLDALTTAIKAKDAGATVGVVSGT
jgi:hypothetical protein